jgi:hypothetical protein
MTIAAAATLLQITEQESLCGCGIFRSDAPVAVKIGTARRYLADFQHDRS